MLPRDTEYEGVDTDKRATDNVILGGKHWTIMRAKLAKDTLGQCHYQQRLIEISTTIRGKNELDTTIHECLHAPFPWLREWAVNQTATEIANVLWKLGYRKVE